MNKIETYEPQMGDYGVIRTNGIAARLIQLGTLSRWNHAVIYQGNDYVVEANPTGVAISHISKYDGKPIAWNRHDNVTAEQRHKIVFHARELIGKRYNFFIILGLVLRIFGVKILGNYLWIFFCYRLPIFTEIFFECVSNTTSIFQIKFLTSIIKIYTTLISECWEDVFMIFYNEVLI